MAVFYGSDTFCLTDVGLVDVQVTDPNILIGQRIARALQIPRGALAAINDDPTRGWDCRQYLQAKMTPGSIEEARRQIEAECLKDEEVKDAKVVINTSNGVLQSININLLSSLGPFTLVGNVNTLTSSLFFNFQ